MTRSNIVKICLTARIMTEVLHTLYNDCQSDSFESKVKIKFIHNQVV